MILTLGSPLDSVAWRTSCLTLTSPTRCPKRRPPLRGELQELERLRTAREEWLASSAAQQRRLDSLSALAEDAATRLPDMGLEEQRRVVELLDLEITVTAYDRPRGKAVVPTVRISGVVPTGNTALPGNNSDVVGVTPLALPDDLPVFVDAPIMALDRVILGGGGRRLKLRLRPAALEALARVTVADIGRPVPA